MCDLSIQAGKFPDKIKIVKVCYIFKSGEQCEIINYRPISASPVVSESLQKLLSNSLFSFLNMNNILAPNQFGFREKLPKTPNFETGIPKHQPNQYIRITLEQ
jgi:hypothetical protein